MACSALVPGGEERGCIGVRRIEVFSDGSGLGDGAFGGGIVDDGERVVRPAIYLLLGWERTELETQGFDIGVLDPFSLVWDLFEVQGVPTSGLARVRLDFIV